jgi:hypothetical protein
MRASINIVQGFFCGADIEPGTFHHLVWPPDSLMKSDSNPDSSAQHDRRDSASDRLTVQRGCKIESAADDGGQIPPVIDRVRESAEKERPSA